MNNGRSSFRSGAVDEEGAAEIAYRALGFLAQDSERFGVFLSLTGVDPGDLRQLAPQRAFLLAILDHLAADESLLLAFTAEAGLAPEAVGFARRALGGGDEP